MPDEEECTCYGVPEDAIILRELHVVEFLNPADDAVYKVDFSHNGSGEDLPLGDVLELAEWIKAVAISPMIAGLIHEYVWSGEEEDPDEDEEVEV